MTLTQKNLADLSAHALREFPKESCGLIVDGDYFACFNYATEPKNDFIIASEVQVQLAAAGRKIQMIVHSHPNGPYFPSELDMRSQINSGLPWALVVTDGERVSLPEIWGAETPVPAIVGRTFMHGVRDCYSLCRDVFRLGKAELAEQNIGWPLGPIIFQDFPREDAWWGTVKNPGEKNLYVDNFAKAGFVAIPREQARPGDGFLMKLMSDRLNHAAVLLENNLLVHHLPGRLSQRVPAGMWARAADQWIRYVGPANA